MIDLTEYSCERIRYKRTDKSVMGSVCMGEYKSFAEEFDKACRNINGNVLQSETGRIHREAIRDKAHAFRDVDIPKPNPWKRRTDLSI